MVFKARKDNNGELDSRINVKGRIQREDKPTNRELKDKYLIELLRKLRPLQAASISQVNKILMATDGSQQNKLKAAAMLLTLYKDLIKEAYGKDEEFDEESTEAIQEGPPARLFSLTMVQPVTKE